MNALALVKGLLSLVSTIVRYLHDKKLMDAGAAQAVLNSLKEADDAVIKANAARADAGKLPVSTDQDNRDKQDSL